MGLARRLGPSARIQGGAKSVCWGIPAAGSRLRILMTGLRTFYVGRLGLSRRRAPSAHIHGGAKDILRSYGGAFQTAGPRLRILMAELKGGGMLELSSRRAPSAHTDGRAEGVLRK